MLDKQVVSNRSVNRLCAALLLPMLLILSIDSARAEIEYEWAGFGSVGAGLLDDDSINQANRLPHNLYDEDLQFDVDTRIGFQGTAFFNERLSATLQVVANSAEDDEVELEWAYLTYDLTLDKLEILWFYRSPFLSKYVAEPLH